MFPTEGVSGTNGRLGWRRPTSQQSFKQFYKSGKTKWDLSLQKWLSEVRTTKRREMTPILSDAIPQNVRGKTTAQTYTGIIDILMHANQNE